MGIDKDIKPLAAGLVATSNPIAASMQQVACEASQQVATMTPEDESWGEWGKHGKHSAVHAAHPSRKSSELEEKTKQSWEQVGSAQPPADRLHYKIGDSVQIVGF